ncbi:DEAD/DEAH box helicase [Micrococcus endophyticus]|uniref:ATP-dependent RNA helicase HelY n=1 Tax=Micrococcus endophyticus TaxID=455343 RepID=A0A7W9JIY5_9MICC|nr:DEAD/DEAH box helicase [Micrococcus endophyticus]MBB5848112.1 ATP-dependent RNA helicase HelY [Micrococcus endophyticus]
MSHAPASATPPEEPQLSPAERFARAKAARHHAGSELGRFASRLGFPLDDFQRRACAEVEDGHGVLVAAPTGAGKTVVGEFAVHLALARGTKAFYTTPIKALSNQKHADLSRVHGAENVGLLTGDTSVNPDAPVVVMTTEVLRNMLYAQSDTLTDLGFVVMDEVHYLADRFRGPVWEEVIIHLPEHVQLISLSATVSNAEEFGAWLDTVRGATTVIVSEHRPVPLWQHVMAGGRLYDLFAEDIAFEDTADRDGEALLNPELKRLGQEAERRSERPDWGRPGRHRGRGGRDGGQRGRGGRGGDGRKGGRDAGRRGRHGSHAMDRERPVTGRVRGQEDGERRGPRLSTSRPEMIRALDREGLLPCITFIFSRTGCDAAVEQCLRAGLDLTTAHEKALVAERVEQAARLLPVEDLEILGYWAWRDGLSRGFAAHHAGMLPPFKEAVEDLFAAGALKAVFATETLALGINMPARSVVIEKLVKFNGENHVDITPGEYTQLTGRAGRRGIDVEGHAVVMWRPGLDPAAVAGLASRRTYPLKSSFRPTYNMSANLLAQVGAERARGILESSFAQFQADRSVVGLAREVRSKQASLEKYEEAMQCHLGDFSEYLALRKELASAEKSGSQGRRRAQLAAVKESLADLAVGDVVELDAGRALGRAVVVFPAGNPQNPRVGVVTDKAQLRRITVDDVAGPVEPVAGAALPQVLQVKTPTQRKDVAALMREAVRTGRPPSGGGRRASGFRLREDPAAPRVEELRRALQRHPCHACQDREEHARWGDRWWGMRREVSVLRERIAGRTNTIARTFDRVVGLLRSYGYVHEDASSPRQALTARGEALRRIYGERDLFTSLVLQDPTVQGLTPEEWAAVAALLVYQGKGEAGHGVVPMPTARLAEVADAAERIEERLRTDEAQTRLEPTPPTDPGLVGPMHRWVRGASLRRTLEGADLAAGDFVRWARQVIDVLDQLANVPGDARRSRACRKAADLVSRGVVATSLPAATAREADED